MLRIGELVPRTIRISAASCLLAFSVGMKEIFVRLNDAAQEGPETPGPGSPMFLAIAEIVETAAERRAPVAESRRELKFGGAVGYANF